MVDLGCGDGRVPIRFAKKFGCNGVGYEFNADLVEICNTRADEENLTDQLRFVKENIFNVDLEPFDFVYAYLRPALNTRLIPQLMQLRPAATILCRESEIPGVKIDQTFYYYSNIASSVKFYLYKTPLEFDPSFRPQPGSLVASEWQKALPKHPASQTILKSQSETQQNMAGRH